MAPALMLSVILAVGILEHDPDIAEPELREAFSSNLYRCTGHENILKRVRDFGIGSSEAKSPNCRVNRLL